MSQFKVGDAVRYTGTLLLPGLGQHGTVVRVDPHDHYQVEFVSAPNDPVQALTVTGVNACGLAMRDEAQPINSRAKPNDILFDVTFKRLGVLHLVHIYAQTRESARCRVAAHYRLDLKEEAAMSVSRP